MSCDSLVVLELSDSFIEVWPQLARDAGLTFAPVASVEELNRHEGAVGIVAAGGEEHRLARAIREINAQYEIAAVAAGGGHRLACDVLHAGAAQLFVLSQDIERLRQWVIDERTAAEARRHELQSVGDGQIFEFPGVVGDSEAMRSALAQAARLLPHAHVTVLITGETGTGKELIARALHDNGPRRAALFVDVNCAAIPDNLLEGELFGYERGAFTDATRTKPGLFEIANGGTLFLDEIGQLPVALQGKLLRALEERTIRRVGGTTSIPVDVRVIAATHVNLLRAVRRGEFRQDLYYRLNVVPITLPPLRARPNDVLPLARYFLAKFAGDYRLAGARFTPGAERILRTRSWPGNVRELRNTIERAVLLARAPLIDASALQPETDDTSSSATPSPHQLSAIIRRTVRETVDLCGGNKSDAARRLGISRTRLQRWLATRDMQDGSFAEHELD